MNPLEQKISELDEIKMETEICNPSDRKRETLYWNRNSFGSLSKMPHDTRKISIPLEDGEMVTGVFTNENGDVIEIEDLK